MLCVKAPLRCGVFFLQNEKLSRPTLSVWVWNTGMKPAVRNQYRVNIPPIILHTTLYPHNASMEPFTLMMGRVCMIEALSSKPPGNVLMCDCFSFLLADKCDLCSMLLFLF